MVCANCYGLKMYYKFWELIMRNLSLYCDNKAAIEIAHNLVQHDRTKHVEVDRHFIKENLDRKVIQFLFVRSEDQLADVLTKAVSGRAFPMMQLAS